MKINDYVGISLTVGERPVNLPPADQAYYPKIGAKFKFVVEGDGYRFKAESDPNDFPNMWKESEYSFYAAGTGPSPDSVHKEQDHLYGVIFLRDREFNVWFIEKDLKLECVTLSITSDVLPHVKNGGYKVTS